VAPVVPSLPHVDSSSLPRSVILYTMNLPWVSADTSPADFRSSRWYDSNESVILRMDLMTHTHNGVIDNAYNMDSRTGSDSD